MARRDPLNVLLIVMDSGRRERFGCYGYPRATTPVIDGLARDGTVFERMIATAPWTLPSHASLFTGLYAREHGADYPGYRMRNGVLTIDRHLQDHGYRTVFVTNNPLVGKRTGIVDAGSELLLRRHVDAGSHRSWVRSLRTLAGRADRGAGASTRAAARMIHDPRRPFFIFMNYMECHWRYMAPHRFERRFVRRRFSLLDAALYRSRLRRRYSWESGSLDDPEEQALLNDLYDAAVACVDSRIGDLLEALDRSGRRDDTLVIVTADHGENLGDHGLSGHGMWLYDSLVHVPFILRAPGTQAGRRVGDLVQMTDVFAGLCRFLDIPIPDHLQHREFAADPAWLSSGRSDRRFAFAEWHHSDRSDLHARLARKRYTAPPDTQAVRDHRYKLIVQPSTGQTWMFDLADDPGETRDRSSDLRAERARLVDALDGWQRTAAPAGTTPVYSADEERAIETRLRELGYL